MSTPTGPGPAARPDWLYGTGATGPERRLVHATAGAALVVLAVALLLGRPEVTSGAGWTWWRLAVVAVLVVDVVGGAVANGLGSAKRLYHGPVPEPATWARRLVHDPRSFTALHVHPIVVALVLPGAPWWWGVLWYGAALAGVEAVLRAPRHLERPVALGVVSVGAVVASVVPAPTGLAWFPVVLLLKLVLAHAVHEEAYRPAR